MPSTHCECGAKFRFAAEHIGRKSKCKKCGAIFVLQPETDEIFAIVDDEQVLARDPAFDHALAAQVAARAAIRPGPGKVIIETEAPETLIDGVDHTRGFWSNVGWTFVFFTLPQNLISFVCLWFVISLAPLVPIVGWIVAFLVGWWYAAWRFEVIGDAASGKQTLPSLGYGGDFVGELLVPAFKWMASWWFVLIPAFLYIMGVLYFGSQIDSAALVEALSGVEGLLLAGKTEPVLVALIALGLFLWPMVILCIAIEGFGAACRIDYIVRTIARSFPAYAVTVVLVFGSIAMKTYLEAQIQAQMAPPPGGGFAAAFGQWIFLGFISDGVVIYFEIVLLRAIGLYYHHFKDRFPWNWG